MNSEQALFIVLPMIAVPLAVCVILSSLVLRHLKPVAAFNLAFGLGAIPLLAWDILSTFAEFAVWRRDDPDLAIGIAQYPIAEALAIPVEIAVIGVSVAWLRSRNRLAAYAVVTGFIVTVAAASMPLSFVIALWLWPIHRLI